MVKRAIHIALLFAAVLSLSVSFAFAQKAPTEYEVKAAFLYNFLKFVEWPPKAFAAKDTPIVIGIVGTDPFSEPGGSTNLLEQAVAGKNIEERKLLVRRVEAGAGLQDCQLIFISSSEKPHLKDILDQLKDSPALTVSELDDFCQLGGIINFVKQAGKIRFEINAAEAEAHHLKISSRLLNVAKIISTSPSK